MMRTQLLTNFTQRLLNLERSARTAENDAAVSDVIESDDEESESCQHKQHIPMNAVLIPHR